MNWLIAGLVGVSIAIGAISASVVTIWIVAVIAERLQARLAVRRRLSALRAPRPDAKRPGASNRRSADIVPLYGPAHGSTGSHSGDAASWRKARMKSRTGPAA